MIIINGGTTRRRDKRAWLLLLGIFVAVFLFTFLTRQSKNADEEVEAASLANFDPGYIISDWQMSDYNSMNEAEIQAFLTSKNSCPNRDYNYYLRLSANSGYKWHWDNGHFVCLSEERFGDGETIGSGDSAAHIIWQAAQDYKINPKVILVLLQKETSLITDPIPNNGDYRKATGYGCPDTAACSSQYYGFKNQVRNAVALFRTVLNGGWTNYPLGNNYIQYNPNAACGGSVVNIRSLATSALYRYTPYQPNAGAIAAGYGTAPCGAYGNRNFYHYFQDWFGGITDEDAPIPESSDIVEGEYMIESKLGNNLVIDVMSGLNANGANIQVYKANNSLAQSWLIKKEADSSYSVRSSIGGKVLDVEGGSRSNGANIQIYSFNNSCAQKWKIVENEDKTYSFYSICSGKVLDVEGGKSQNGGNIQLYKKNGSSAQKWRLRPVKTIEDGEYYINTDLGNDILMDSDSNGNVLIKKDNGTNTQKWKVEYGSDGYYTLKNVLNGKLLDIDNNNVTNGTNVIIHDGDDLCGQKWQILKNEDKTYVIYSKCAKFVLDVNGAGVVDGTNIQMYTNNNTKAQKWIFKVCDDSSFGGDYMIQSALKENMMLDISGGAVNASNNTNIQIYQKNNTTAQRWQLMKNNDDTYTIFNSTANKVLDVFGGWMNNGVNVQLFSNNGSCAQKWKVVENNDGTYTFYSQCSNNKVLDVWGGSTNNGANVQLYTFNGTSAQKWKLLKI